MSAKHYQIFEKKNWKKAVGGGEGAG